MVGLKIELDLMRDNQFEIKKMCESLLQRLCERFGEDLGK